MEGERREEGKVGCLLLHGGVQVLALVTFFQPRFTCRQVETVAKR